jgi:hypothetical protein
MIQLTERRVSQPEFSVRRKNEMVSCDEIVTHRHEDETLRPFVTLLRRDRLPTQRRSAAFAPAARRG